MYLSKIWFFLVAVAASVAVTIALVLPRPAERESEKRETKRLRRSCDIANILLKENARARIQLAADFAQVVRQMKLSTTLFQAAKGNIVAAESNSTARKELLQILDDPSLDPKPSFVILVDRKGRVVARSGPDDKKYGDSVAGYFLVDEALNGYLRDDLWDMDGKLYRVAASPVFTRQLDWAGAVIVGHAFDKEFAERLSKSLDAKFAVYSAGKAVAFSDPVQIHDDVAAHAKGMVELEEGTDCEQGELLEVATGSSNFAVITARLPGEAGLAGAFYSVFIEQEGSRGFRGTLSAVTKDDLSFGKFPWIPLVAFFLVVVGGGLVIMIIEGDRPLRHLAKDAVELAKGEKERLDEMGHRGRFGSVARSVNIAIDKLHRDAKAAKKDLDQLLGPAPGDSGAMASALPAVGPAGEPPAATPPPPSEFKFTASDDLGIPIPPDPLGIPSPPPSTTAPATPPPMPPAGGAPPPIPKAPVAEGAPTNSPVPPKPIGLPTADEAPATADKTLDDDILGGADGGGDEVTQDGGDQTRVFEGMRQAAADMMDAGDNGRPEAADEDAYFRDIFHDFIALKRQCGESIDTLTFERFAKKLRTNRDALIAKHGCKSVKFQVYVKDGKAALKASPVK